jgi:hypothetical protein
MFLRRFLSVAAVMLPFQASAAEVVWTEVAVRVYDSSGANAGERQEALDVAASIVELASVELIWRTCDRPAIQHRSSDARRSDRCQTPLAPGELAIRILRSKRIDENRELPLGDAFLNRDTGNGVLATVYFDRVEWLARQTGVDRPTLLGRAIAHELGHLLMATSAHSSIGLMRPIWSHSEIRRQQRTDWVFAPLEVAAIRARRPR